MSRRAVRRRVRRFMIAALVILAFFSGFFGHTLLNARAEEKKGDTLWSLAEQYGEGIGYSQKEYVEELRRINGLRDEQIHSGEYLTVVYSSK